MKLIVGLGNPGRKYAATRHNIGFEVLAKLANRFAAEKPKARFDGELTEILMDSQRVLLLWPLTYMNSSGSSVQPARDFYKVTNEELLIVCDDVSLPTGKLRLRAKGSSGGQNGLKDIIRRLGTEEFARLRIGIGPLPPQWDMADYVLSKFGKDEEPAVGIAVQAAAEAAEDWVRHGIATAMNKYNAS
jgi:PTH1 family peptidyl-tRNA hydrolase